MVDWTKPIQTRGGRPARFLGVIGDDKRPHVVAVAVADCDMREQLWQVTVEGTYHQGAEPSALDIINVPVRRTVHLNFYDAGTDCVPICSVHDTKELADSISGGCMVKVACVEVTYTEGEGLE